MHGRQKESGAQPGFPTYKFVLQGQHHAANFDGVDFFVACDGLSAKISDGKRSITFRVEELKKLTMLDVDNVVM
jgi:hypothetical protein